MTINRPNLDKEPTMSEIYLKLFYRNADEAEVFERKHYVLGPKKIFTQGQSQTLWNKS